MANAKLKNKEAAVLKAAKSYAKKAEALMSVRGDEGQLKARKAVLRAEIRLLRTAILLGRF